jgi:hypothetical protein
MFLLPQKSAFVLALAVIVFPSGALLGQQSETQPLDPLTDGERAEIERLVHSEPRVRELLGPGARASYVELLALKGRDPDEVLRHAEVLLLREDSRFGARVVVALGVKPTIASVERVNESAVPMTDAELQRAAKLADANADVRRALSDQREQPVVEGLRIVTTDKSDPCYAQRCVRLLYRFGSDYMSEPIVVVNLSKGSVQIQRRKR